MQQTTWRMRNASEPRGVENVKRMTQPPTKCVYTCMSVSERACVPVCLCESNEVKFNYEFCLLGRLVG